MTSHGFRLRFLLPEGSAINYDAESLDIPLPSGGLTLVLQSVSKNSIRDARNLTIRGTGFACEDEARGCGRRTKNALMLCGARLRMGVDVGKDKATSGAGKVVEARAREMGVRLLDDVHGLVVFPEDMPVRFASVTGTLTVGESATRFVEELGKAYDMSRELTPKQSVALELYSASKFELSQRASFLSLIIAVECLSGRERQPEHVLDHLEDLIALMEKSLEGPEKEAIVDGLGRLKTESISRACKKMVAKYLGPKDVELWQICYDARGKIVHKGKPPEGFDLGHWVEELDKLVSQLLTAHVASVESSQKAD